MRRILFHILISSVDHRIGGMETSALRIAHQLLTLGENRIVIYQTYPTPQFSIPSSERIEFVDLSAARDKLGAPLNPLDPSYVDDVYRLNKLVLCSSIIDKASKYLDHQSMLVSFYISSSGFVAQNVASELNLPHIACVRGTDFSRDYYSPYRRPGIEFVIRKATFVVATNRVQERILRTTTGRSSNITTIYNSLAEDSLPLWQFQKRSYVQLVADCGYSFKKATHTLLDTVAVLCEEGYQLKLAVIGNTDPESLEYWQTLRRSYLTTFADEFSLEGYRSQDIPSFLMKGDIYCSTSLSEGCSNAHLRALAIGIPIVATNTGVLAELTDGANHILLSPSGNEQMYRDNLRIMCDLIREGGINVSADWVNRIREACKSEHEQTAWKQVVEASLLNH